LVNNPKVDLKRMLISSVDIVLFVWLISQQNIGKSGMFLRLAQIFDHKLCKRKTGFCAGE
jgi:hypothetical protein